ncbi:MAG: AAA family ATPase [Alphaproteobacteria bacterium]|nr:AAA family ATPase [Alphaproteobacteria bacterium]
MTTVTQKTKQILVLCGSLMLTGSAFAVSSGEGGDENVPPHTPRTTARLSTYPSLFSAMGAMKNNHIGINREVRKFIRETYPDGIDENGLNEFRQQLAGAPDLVTRDVYNHITKTLLPLYSVRLREESSEVARKRGASSDGGDERGDFSRALTLSTRSKAPRTVLGDITNTVDRAMSPLALPPLVRDRRPLVLSYVADSSSTRKLPLALPSISEESAFEDPGIRPVTSLPSIPALEEELNRRIIGEEPAMASFATGLHVHYTIQDVNNTLEALGRSVRVPKQNIFMCGPTGCGKTASVKAAAKKLGRTFFEADTSGFTRTGYVGDSVSSVIVGLIREAQEQITEFIVGSPEYKRKVIELVQKGIVFLDEFDKIGAKKSGASERDIAGTDVQSEFLKLMEGKKITVKVDREDYTIDTTNILFIAGGAFSSIEREGGEAIGPEAFVDAGFSEQVLGRFSRRIFFEGMTQEKFVRILHSEEASPIVSNLLLLQMGYGVDVKFDDEAMRLIAERGYAMNAGVRGLASMVSTAVDPLIRRSEELRGTTVTIDKAFAEANLPEIKPRKKVVKPYTFEDHIRDHPREEYGFYN